MGDKLISDDNLDDLVDDNGVDIKESVPVGILSKLILRLKNKVEELKSSCEGIPEKYIDLENDIVPNSFGKNGVVDGKILMKHKYTAFIALAFGHFIGIGDIEFAEYFAIKVCKGIEYVRKKL